MFKWDGTDVTLILKDANIYSGCHEKHKYWYIKFNHNDDYEICIVKNAKSTIPCLIDETKQIFGLQKVGTHWCDIGGLKLLLKPNMTPEGYIVADIPLSKFKVDHKDKITDLFKMQIQEIFAFRELMGITCSFESSIVVRENKNTIYPLSYYEPNMKLEDGKIIPYSILDNWFEEKSIDTVVKNKLKVFHMDDINNTLHRIRNQLEEIIEKTDRRNITYKTIILNRITERLQTAL